MIWLNHVTSHRGKVILWFGRCSKSPTECWQTIGKYVDRQVPGSAHSWCAPGSTGYLCISSHVWTSRSIVVDWAAWVYQTVVWRVTKACHEQCRLPETDWALWPAQSPEKKIVLDKEWMRMKQMKGLKKIKWGKLKGFLNWVFKSYSSSINPLGESAFFLNFFFNSSRM